MLSLNCTMLFMRKMSLKIWTIFYIDRGTTAFMQGIVTYKVCVYVCMAPGVLCVCVCFKYFQYIKTILFGFWSGLLHFLEYFDNNLSLKTIRQLFFSVQNGGLILACSHIVIASCSIQKLRATHFKITACKCQRNKI